MSKGQFPARVPAGAQPREQREMQPNRRVKVVFLVEDTEPGRPRTWTAGYGTVELGAIGVEKLYERENPNHARARALSFIEDEPLIDSPRVA
jgi:hypothetical protein